jgi:hypothetical protein
MFVINLVTPKAAAKRELLFNPSPLPRGWFAEQKLTLSYSFRCDQILSFACYEFGHTLLCCFSLTWMFNKSHSEAHLLNKSLSFGAALGVTQFIVLVVMNLVTLCCSASV